MATLSFLRINMGNVFFLFEMNFDVSQVDFFFQGCWLWLVPPVFGSQPVSLALSRDFENLVSQGSISRKKTNKYC